MSLIKCNECGTEISKKAKECPKCGLPKKKRTSFVTWAVTGFMVLGFIGYINDPSGTDKVAGATKKPQVYPVSKITYEEINAQVGCKSKYSDDKKEDIFKSNYKDHWMTWKGEVALAETDNVSLNIDGFGTQDLQVTFTDTKAGYDLIKDTVVTVKFLMKTSGGCFLPFSGKHAVIL